MVVLVVLRDVAWECLCLCGGKGKKVLWEGSLRAALGHHAVKAETYQ